MCEHRNKQHTFFAPFESSTRRKLVFLWEGGAADKIKYGTQAPTWNTPDEHT
jgi:hypothetical protein